MTSSTLEISADHLQIVKEHAEECRPEECCGILLGHIGPARRVVLRVERAENVADAQRSRRYLVSPVTLARTLHRASREGLVLVGFYHSHTEGPPTPSRADVAEAWSATSYLIYSVRDRLARSWRFTLPELDFVEERLRLP